MYKFNLFKVSQSERNDFCEHIIDSSAPKFDFHFLVILSTIIVALGMVGENIVLVIGGMLVTPILSPVMAISLGIIIRNAKVLWRSIRIFFISLALTVLVAYMIGILADFDITDIELINMMKPSLYTFILATVAGLAASFTWVKPNLNGSLPGIAITVTLIPPLTTVGLALAVGNMIMLNEVLYVLFLNVTGIILGSIIIFILMEFWRSKKKLIAEVKEEEKEMQK